MLRARSLLATALTCLMLAAPAAPASARPNGADAERIGSGSVDAYTDFKAGYTIPPGDVSIARATFTLPSLDCGTRKGITMGLGSEPAFHDASYLATVWMRCYSGRPDYLMSATVFPDTRMQAPAAAGDRIEVSIERRADGMITPTVANLTSGVVATITGMPRYGDPLVDGVDFGAFPLFRHGHRLYNAPKFGVVRFTHATVTIQGSEPVCISETGPTQNTRIDRDGHYVEVKPTQLSRCGFALKWLRY